MTTEPGASSGRLPWLLLAAATAAVAVAVLVYATGLFRWPAPSAEEAGPPPDPRLTYTGPYQNIHPEVKFVSDDVCQDCHLGRHLEYSNHPMGRSMVAIDDLADSQRYDEKSRNPFDALGRRFRVVRENGKVWHQQSAIYEGEVLYEHRQPVHYAIGSGTRGYSYITEINGLVYQTPISWFSEKGIWDLSPGFSPALALGRPVIPGCLQCHVNRALTIPGESTRYEKGVFDGHAIGCQRCHGPGEKHVAYHRPGPRWQPRDFDPTIVNPAKLEPRLRDNVCEQCHLQGEARVLRHGRDWFDYRPGLPLEQFFSVFVKDRQGGSRAEAKAVNHVEQMHASTCFQKTAGKNKLGCISCHDPHVKPEAAERVAYFRDRCLSCHGPGRTVCKEPVAERQQKAPGDSCIDCHMPKGDMTNIAHTSLTDHSIPRDAGSVPRLRRPPEARWGRMPLIHFHYDRLSGNDPEARRDLGLALAKAPSGGPASRWGETGDEALIFLDAAVRRAPGDAAAWLARGEVQARLGRHDDAVASLERCLSLWPRDQSALSLLAELKTGQGKAEEALALRRRLVELLPHVAVAHRDVALLLLEANRWDEAGPSLREWRRLDPGSAEAREKWLMYLAREGDKTEARREMALLRKLLPPGSPQAQRIERWFARHVGP